jgi:hypothetical protein
LLDIGDEIGDLLEDSPLDFDVTHVKDREADLAILDRVTDYGLVYIHTHGSFGQRFATGEIENDASNERYDALIQSRDIVPYTMVVSRNLIFWETEESVYTVNDDYISTRSGQFPNSLIVNRSCQSSLTHELYNAFRDKGAQAYLGFSETVYTTFSGPVVLDFFERFTPNLSTVGEAFVPDQVEDSEYSAEFELLGNEALAYPLDITNGDFEVGTLDGWTDEGDGRVISGLGVSSSGEFSVYPHGGFYMGLISTGLGRTTASGALSQAVLVPADAAELRVAWNFLSEEFLEYVGSQYQDYFRIRIEHEGGSTTVFKKAIDDIAGEFNLIEYPPSELTFDQGGVYGTGWQTAVVDISAYQGSYVTIHFEASDIGDSLYDTAILLDNVFIQ